jgi:hypothetical protein
MNSTTTLYYSKRKECSGYLELIFRKDPDAEPDKNVQAIAYITDHYSNNQPLYTAHYGIYEFVGTSVASVKQGLFEALDSGL